MTMIPGSASAASGKRPYVFKDNLLAEILPHGVYRLTSQEGEEPPVAVVVSPSAGYLIAQSDGKREIVPFHLENIQKFKSETFRTTGENLYRILVQGEKILYDHGYRMKADPAIHQKLEGLYRDFLDRPAVSPESLKAGDLVAILYRLHEEKLYGFYAFQLDKSGPTWGLKNKVAVLLNPEHQIQEVSFGDYAPEWPLFEHKTVRITSKEHAFLLETAKFYEEENNPGDGLKLFEEARSEYRKNRFLNQMESSEQPNPPDLREEDRMGEVFL